MGVKYKDLGAVDLKRESLVQYDRTRPVAGTPPAGCNSADIVPVSCVLQDFNLPNGVINSTWVTAIDNVFSNCDALSILGGRLLSFNPVLNSTNGVCAAYDSAFVPAAGAQISSIVFQGAVLPGAPLPPPVQSVGIGCGLIVRASGGPNMSQFTGYVGIYQELYQNVFGFPFSGSFAVLKKWQAGAIVQTSGTDFVSGTPRIFAGMTLQLNVNDDAGGAQLTCVRLLADGTSRRTMNDTNTGGPRILSGTPGIGAVTPGYSQLAGTLADNWAGCTASL